MRVNKELKTGTVDWENGTSFSGKLKEQKRSKARDNK